MLFDDLLGQTRVKMTKGAAGAFMMTVLAEQEKMKLTDVEATYVGVNLVGLISSVILPVANT